MSNHPHPQPDDRDHGGDGDLAPGEVGLAAGSDLSWLRRRRSRRRRSTVTGPGVKRAARRGTGRRARARLGSRPGLALPAHRATTRDACVLYPGVGSPCTGVRGPLLGADRLSGDTSFHFDLVEAYQQGGLIDNTNMFVLGKPGNGKSALIKTLIWRSLGCYGSDRFFCIIDVKGEYRALAQHAGFTVLDLRPGGTTRINPLGRPATPGEETAAHQTARHRVNIIAALCAAQLGAPLTAHQEALLYAAMAEIHHLEQTRLAGQASEIEAGARLADVVQLLQAPTEAMRHTVYAASEVEVRAHGAELVVALDGLLTRSMQGMFDGDTPLDLDPRRTRGLVVDLSAINDDDAAVPLVMVAVTGWLRELMRADWGSVRKIQIFDEAWLVMRHHAIVSYLQDTWKLGRTYGFANIAVLHRPSDLLAQTDAGTAAAAMAVGLLADTDTIVSYAQNADELATHGDLLGWTVGERTAIARLERGESLWAIGERHRVLLAHVINTGTEAALCDTDHNLTRSHDHGRPRPR